ncbi:hypothetical protein [Streptomyces sp. SID9727]|uniref:hypothetical protein n=1 Tax=Streptomyces sp. SID9727 TaxID=2706114 RepID=UPI001940FFAB|nr:hypothetical protein [Streptomyces sp. SID9727]
MTAVALRDATGSSLGVTFYAGGISLVSLVAAVLVFRMTPGAAVRPAPVAAPERRSEAVRAPGFRPLTAHLWPVTPSRRNTRGRYIHPDPDPYT